ncbi:hypothetical protein [Nocardia sp. CA-120079]|uniref:hypothetical protein n=1 Tax=Nocardia sp. CA-120079 TaxID=3239974 RepID=UPI003D995248
MATQSGTDIRTDDAHGWGWLDDNTAVELPLIGSRATPSDHPGNDEWDWLNNPPPPHGSALDPDVETKPGRLRGLPAKAWAALGAVALSATSVVIAGGFVVRDEQPPTAAPTMPAATPPSTPPTRPACQGLTAPVVTDTTDGPDPMTRAIAGFEHAYYQGDADAALRFLAPEAGILPEALAVGIASIPKDTRHCVAITPIADTTATVHLVELHLDNQRIDYLQVINVRITDAVAAISRTATSPQQVESPSVSSEVRGFWFDMMAPDLWNLERMAYLAAAYQDRVATGRATFEISPTQARHFERTMRVHHQRATAFAHMAQVSVAEGEQLWGIGRAGWLKLHNSYVSAQDETGLHDELRGYMSADPGLPVPQYVAVDDDGQPIPQADSVPPAPEQMIADACAAIRTQFIEDALAPQGMTAAIEQALPPGLVGQWNSETTPTTERPPHTHKEAGPEP